MSPDAKSDASPLSPSSAPARIRGWTFKLVLLGITARFLFELIEYFGGRSGIIIHVLGIPAAIVPGVILLVASAGILACGVGALYFRNLSTLGAATIGVAVMWGNSFFTVLPDSFLVGYRGYLLAAASFDEMRKAGQQFQALETREIRTTGERYIVETRRAELWASVETPAKLREATRNAVVTSNEDYFAIINGSALTGHWGVRVYYKGSPEKQAQDWIFWISDERVAFFKEQD